MDSPATQSWPASAAFRPEEAFAREADAADPLRHLRDRFHLPQRADGRPVIYFCGHSLGLQPRTVQTLMQEELDAWARLGVDAHFKEKASWYAYHELFADRGARLVGSRPGEVVMMNSLTVNLHLMMATFYRPEGRRRKVLVEGPTFPSDLYAVESQIRHHSLDPEQDLLTIGPRLGEFLIRMEDLETLLEQRGPEIAVVLLSGVNFFTGQLFDVERITALAKRQGCVAGFDLAHAAGNVPLSLHDWEVDFAVWCNYKYLNAGPGAIGGCFVHASHGGNLELPRLAGWWGNDPATRFQHVGGGETALYFVPRPGADGWQISNPPIFAMVPLLASLAIFDEAGMPALRARSQSLSGYLLYLLDRLPAGRFDILTPREPAQRGAQVSILVRERPRELLRALEAADVVCDFRKPNVIRVAPVPLYNTFQEVWRFAQLLREWR